MANNARPLGGLDRHVALAHSRRSLFRRRLMEARGAVSAALEFMARPYVAFSCGKDSAVLAHLVTEIDRSVPLRFLSSGETRILHDVDGVIDWFRGRGCTVEEINIDRVFGEGWQDATWEQQRKAGRGDLDKLNIGHDGVFMGLRMEESPKRKRSLLMHRDLDLPPFCYRYESGIRKGMVRACPLARWTTGDIAAYAALYEIPLLAAYHDLGMEARTTARLTGDSVRQYTLTHMKYHNVEAYHAIIRRFPELGGLA